MSLEESQEAIEDTDREAKKKNEEKQKQFEKVSDDTLTEALNLIQLTQEMGLGQKASVSTLVRGNIIK
jgi:hypothetical protein